jgi:hypothetical protein
VPVLDPKPAAATLSKSQTRLPLAFTWRCEVWSPGFSRPRLRNFKRTNTFITLGVLYAQPAEAGTPYLSIFALLMRESNARLRSNAGQLIHE